MFLSSSLDSYLMIQDVILDVMNKKIRGFSLLDF
uniref:Photosystem II protein I n=2 Tax=Litsea TaxID=22042 RepID=A0A1B0ZE34_9MAGN|nr:photosystem II protein I [Litsea acutivena]YP_009921422.1 photosystem II protein I [Litsea glutinosa]ANP25840.1 photosystem II protein I [Litsea glutinosa]QMS49719.1 photosystem II protein I [Litsea acutivena]QMS49962.1 photosystem II protein I [Litsea glutinosa]